MTNKLPDDLSKIPTARLFALYREVLNELLDRKIVRTTNAPTGDYAEYLVARFVNGELAGNSEKSWDVRSPDGLRMQVKCRVVIDPRKHGQRQLSPFRSFDFDEAIVVLFDGTFQVWRAVSIPVETVKQLSVYRKHVNGFILHANDALLASGVRDITTELRAISNAGDPRPD